jgi:hypothetical protein
MMPEKMFEAKRKMSDMEFKRLFESLFDSR